jgi:hypothetical protein
VCRPLFFPNFFFKKTKNFFLSLARERDLILFGLEDKQFQINGTKWCAYAYVVVSTCSSWDAGVSPNWEACSLGDFFASSILSISCMQSSQSFLFPIRTSNLVHNFFGVESDSSFTCYSSSGEIDKQMHPRAISCLLRKSFFSFGELGHSFVAMVNRYKPRFLS